MDQIEELSIEEANHLVISYLNYRLNKDKECQDSAFMMESSLYYARDNLFKSGLSTKDNDLINQAKIINSLMNLLRGQPPENYWNGLLKDHGLPINNPVLTGR